MNFKDNKYGIKIPKNIVEAYAFDRGNVNTAWWDTIRKKMKGIFVAFDVLDEGVTLSTSISDST